MQTFKIGDIVARNINSGRIVLVGDDSFLVEVTSGGHDGRLGWVQRLGYMPDQHKKVLEHTTQERKVSL